MNRITLQEVARLAGVSAMTVSRALKNSGKVAPGTLRSVQDAVKKSGYQPDPMLSALAQYRHGKKVRPDRASLLYLYPGRSLPIFASVLARHQVYAEYYRGACLEAESLGYRIEPVGMSDLVQEGTLQRMVSARGTAGVIVAPMHPFPRHLRQMEVSVPLVALGWSWPGAVNRVAHDHYGSMLLIMEKIVGRGFLRPGLLLSDGVDASSNRMWSGCFRRQMELNNHFSRPVIPYEPFNRKIETGPWTRRWKPDVVISLDWVARGILALNKKKGPALISVESMKGSPISGVDQNSEEVGRQAVDFIHSLVSSSRQTSVPLIRLVPGTWNSGKTFPGEAAKERKADFLE